MVTRLTGFLRRVPLAVKVILVAAWAGAAIWDRSATTDERATPVGVSIVLWSGLAVVAVFGLIRFLRSWYAADRPPFDPISRGWLLFVVVTGTLLVLPVVDLVRRDPAGNAAIETAMFLAGLGLVGLVVRYARKPVWDRDIPLDEFYSDDRRRLRSTKVVYGGGWRTRSDPGGLYVVGWIEGTREICALRSPLVPPWLRVAPESAFSSALLGDAAVVEVLGWADNREALDRALPAWERHMDEADGLGWVRRQLALAAEST